MVHDVIMRPSLGSHIKHCTPSIRLSYAYDFLKILEAGKR